MNTRVFQLCYQSGKPILKAIDLTPGNDLFTFTLSHLPTARSLIETRFPAAVVEQLDLDSIVIESGSFIDPSLAEKFSDVLLSVKMRLSQEGSRQRVLAYFLFEHKSEPDSAHGDLSRRSTMECRDDYR